MKKGKWYYIKQYGFSYNLKGQYTGEKQNGKTLMRFYWGAPFRNRHWVADGKIGDECPSPHLFSNN